MHCDDEGLVKGGEDTDFTGLQPLPEVVPKFHNAGVRGSSPCVATKQNKGLAKAKPFFFRADYIPTTLPILA